MNRLGIVTLLLVVATGVVAMGTTAVVIFFAPDIIAPFYRVFAPRANLGTTGANVVNPGQWLDLMGLAIFTAPLAGALGVFVARRIA
ncbi:hypothetical protein [Halorubrum aethiopicum]|uniref:hypothetical protein n=1 Tax=Halorubrum aethiopicum TaxID=1758255 RepID=UPI000836E42A|nr:hypothetical protein [Halorubrum aethiopicum]